MIITEQKSDRNEREMNVKIDYNECGMVKIYVL